MPKPTEETGVPIKLLREFENKTITVDTATGEVFTGTLHDAEDNLSLTLTNAKVVFASGHEVSMHSVYIKGVKIRLISLPSGAREKVQQLERESRSLMRGRGGRGGGRGGSRRGFRGRR
ncbi:small nuclear ribonucleoprotein Sm D3 [Parasteatoda tepidariorum]|uniref:Small nuclear ribonucleoprotein Sm D3 n=1 Tax=Parasteatoda tepidariorum TaxID=114398 RepID=A0A2L2Y2N5_PARTP|nr:small nuclear ribonucleoprotein Sm D3 [Parasteatoda tepidariorum]